MPRCSSLIRHGLVLLATTASLAVTAQAQPQAQPQNQPHGLSAPPQRVVHLTAQAEQRLPHDWVVLTLSARHQAADARTVQHQLNDAVQQALSLWRPQLRPEWIEASTAGMSVQPRYGREGQIVGWQGSAELTLQGRDMAAVAALAQEAPGLTVTAVRMMLARATQRAAEAALRQQAIAAFRQQADEVAQAFGARGWTLREAHVNPAPLPAPGEPIAMRTLAASPSVEALPLQPGLAWLQLTVTGSVALE